jgi:hypothetical protein
MLACVKALENCLGQMQSTECKSISEWDADDAVVANVV